MKITTTERPDGPYEPDGYLSTKIETKEGKSSASFGAGEPEDFSLTRDLSDAYEIKDMLILAYNAGKNGEELKVEHIEEE